jgi:hypothetical protein
MYNLIKIAMNVLARNFYNIFKMAYLPYAGTRNGFSRLSLKITVPKYEEKVCFKNFRILNYKN